MRPYMTLGQSFKAYFQNFATFDGRASRSEYWWAQVGLFLVTWAAMIIATLSFLPALAGDVWSLGFGSILLLLLGLWSLVLIIPSLAITVRRLHDANLSGWWFLITFVPGIGGLCLFVFTVLPSNPEGARFDGPYQPKTGN